MDWMRRVLGRYHAREKYIQGHVHDQCQLPPVLPGRYGRRDTLHKVDDGAHTRARRRIDTIQ